MKEKTGKNVMSGRINPRALSQAGRNDAAKPSGKTTKGTEHNIKTQKAPH